MSTFHGLEMAKQALFTQQSALYTTGHNIANANTEGYSRQRVNFQADTAMPAAAKNRMGIPGQIGTGVKAGSIERIRNEFLDTQFRGENSLSGYWEKRAESLGRMEDVLNDLNETGLSSVMDEFWSSLQDLAVNPTNAGARSVVVQRGIALADTFNHLDQSLTQIRSQLKEEIDHTVANVNQLTTSINELNDQIRKLEVNGYVTNDLYDQRDRLIDELSRILPIEVETSPSGDYVNAVAEGLVTIKVGDQVLVDAGERKVETVSISFDNSSSGNVTDISIGENEIALPENQGTLLSLVNAYGYQSEDGTITGDYINMQTNLRELAEGFKNQFNSQHTQGVDLKGNPGGAFFAVGTDDEGNWEMRVSSAIQEDPSLIAASPEPEDDTDNTSGDGSNAFLLAEVFDQNITIGNENKSVREFYAEQIGSLAVQVEEAERMHTNTGVLLTQLEGNRQSVSSVSLDEEMTNMVKFQHAYNAAARSMTATDELLDRIINNMGLVGR